MKTLLKIIALIAGLLAIALPQHALAGYRCPICGVWVETPGHVCSPNGGGNGSSTQNKSAAEIEAMQNLSRIWQDQVDKQASEDASMQPAGYEDNSPYSHRNYGAQTCFIATAAYGTPWQKNVLKLRLFRENILLKSKVGRKFVQFYYKHSPAVARQIQSKPIWRFFTRLILTPIVVLAGVCMGDASDIFYVLMVSFALGYLFLSRRLIPLYLKKAQRKFFRANASH